MPSASNATAAIASIASTSLAALTSARLCAGAGVVTGSGASFGVSATVGSLVGPTGAAGASMARNLPPVPPPVNRPRGRRLLDLDRRLHVGVDRAVIGERAGGVERLAERRAGRDRLAVE